MACAKLATDFDNVVDDIVVAVDIVVIIAIIAILIVIIVLVVGFLVDFVDVVVVTFVAAVVVAFLGGRASGSVRATALETRPSRPPTRDTVR